MSIAIKAYIMSVFKVPFTCIVSGSSGSGKTTFVERLLKERNEIIQPSPLKVLYCFGELTPKILEWKQRQHYGITVH